MRPCDSCLWKDRCDHRPTEEDSCLYLYTETTEDEVVADYIFEERVRSVTAFFSYIDLFYNEEDGDYHS